MMDWQDLHVAFVVSQEGTASGAARVLGVHHATIIRHIDRLESALGQKLFRRHGRGYEATDIGQQLFNVAAVANEQFMQAHARIEGQEVEIDGKIVITTLPSIAEIFMPAFATFHEKFPNVQICLESSSRVYRLDYGEAHLAIRAGEKPSDTDNVVVPLLGLPIALYSHRNYAEKTGLFSEDQPEGHRFIANASKDARSPMDQWLHAQGLSDQIVMDLVQNSENKEAILAGIGLGFLPVHEAENDPQLVEHLPSRSEWVVKIWQVTHRDMHRTPKVEAMREVLREFTRSRSDALLGS